MTVTPGLLNGQASGSVFSQLKPYLKAPPIFQHDVVLTEFIRQTHPDHHVTITSSSSIDLEGFADAGFASMKVVKDPEVGFLADRTYNAPAMRVNKDQGVMRDDMRYALINYTFQDVPYLIYDIFWMRGQNRAGKYYILSPRKLQEIDSAGDSPLNDRLIKTMMQWSREMHDEILVYDRCWSKSKLLYEAVKKASWSDVVLAPSAKSGIIDDVVAFFRNRSLYAEMNVPWKRGIIFHGPPGNGKTITIKALMNELGNRAEDPLPSLYVKSFENENGGSAAIRQIFSQARLMAPCLLIFEDLDSLVTPKLRSYFLNEVDGLESNDGILMIGSTNHLDNLDPAIAKRPSRFDRKYAFELPDATQRHLYAKYWQQKFEKNPRVSFDADAADFFTKISDGFSFAYMKELFVTSLMITVGESGDQIESDLNADKKAIDQEAEKDGPGKASKANELLANIKIPEGLLENKFVQVLHKQGIVLRYEMDSTDETGKIKEKVRTS